MHHQAHRADIDGLRAFAVLAVIGFHAGLAPLGGGFAGVDVFFVISGFLISGILFRELAQDRFSFASFYTRRIKRIFPSLIVVLALSLAFAWHALLADEFKLFGKNLAGGAAFAANFINWSDAGYFDIAADKKPLLHLWSLGIEEQFYVFWPLLVWGAWKMKHKLLLPMLALAALSFGLNLHDIGADRVAAFYSPQTRFWELLCGSLLAWQVSQAGKGDLLQNAPPLMRPRLGHAASLTGFLLLLGSALFLNKSMAYPSAWTLLPVVGTVLLIAAGPDAIVNRRLLANPLLTSIGLISYPLYLWHYPLLSFARIVGSGEPDSTIRIGLMLAALVLAWLTYALVEKPIRFSRNPRAGVMALLFLMGLLGSFGYFIYHADGLPLRDVQLVNPDAKSGFMGGDGGVKVDGCGLDAEEQALFAACSHDVREAPTFALLGDSKAGVLSGGLYRTSHPGGRWMFIGGNGDHGAPAPVLSDRDIYKKYQPTLRLALKAIARIPSVKTVVLATATRSLFDLRSDRDIDELPSSGNYAPALEGLDAAVDALIKAGKKVVIVIDNPTLPPPEDCIGRRTALPWLNDVLGSKNENCTLSLAKYRMQSQKYRALLEEIRARHPAEVRLFDTVDILCDTQHGVCEPYKYGRVLYGYTDHVSDFGAGLIGVQLNDFLETNR